MIQPTSSAHISPKIHQKVMIVDKEVVRPDAVILSQEQTPNYAELRQQFFAGMTTSPSPSLAETEIPSPALHGKEFTVDPATNPDGYNPASEGSPWSNSATNFGVDLTRDYNATWGAFNEQFFSDPRLK